MVRRPAGSTLRPNPTLLPSRELGSRSALQVVQRNLYTRQRDRARDLETRLDQIAKAASPAAAAPIDADAEARLRSLGYGVASPTARPQHYGAADDPKQLAHLNPAPDEAATMWARGNSGGRVHTPRR